MADPKPEGIPMPAIPKLKGDSNYPQWQGAIQFTLENFDLEHFIERTVP